MSYPVYATLNDLLTYMHVDEISDNNAEFLLDRANEIVYLSIRRIYNADDELHVEAAIAAVCAQTAYWLNTGNSPLSDASISGYTLGDMSITKGTVTDGSAPSPSGLCMLARTYLNNAGLLYKGIISRYTEDI